MAKRPRNWVDSRLIIGIVLVIGSVLGVVGVVQHLAQTTTVYVTRVDVATGDRITAEQLTAMEVSVSAPTELYLTQLAQEGYVASRPIGAGELVPLAALGSADTSSAVVMVAISGEIPGGISPGTQVALWGANPGEQPGTYEKPQVIVAAAQ